MDYDHIFSIGPENLEDVHYYRRGFFHPVEINDTFKNGRYAIVHKLGHGGFSTVWLAHDTQSQTNKYVALKVLGAHGSRNVNEIAVHKWLSKYPDSFDSSKIAKLLDYFVITGPNGRHVGLVFEAYGPALAALSDAGIKIRPDFVRTIAKQIAYLVKNCHDNDIAVGDLSTKNILLELSEFQDWSLADIYNCFGDPKPWKMIPMNKTEQFPSCGPKNLYPSIEVGNNVAPFIKPKVVLADLNDMTCTERGDENSVQSGSLCINSQFAGPELILSLERRHTKPLDVWALAAVFYNIRTMDTLIHANGFSGGSDLYEVQQLLGEVPERLKTRIRAAEAKWEQFLKDTKEDSSDYLPVPFIQSDELEADASLHERLAAVGTWSKFHSLTTHQKIQCILETTSMLDRKYTLDLDLDSDPYAAPPPARFSDEELKDFEDLLSRMLKYVPEERFTISEVLEHPWLNKNYEYFDDMNTPWLALCTGGWQYLDLDDWYEEVIVNGGTWQQPHHPGRESDDDGNNMDSDSRTELEEEGSHLEEELCTDNNVAPFDTNTRACENLEHVFIWQRQILEGDSEDDEVVVLSTSLRVDHDDEIEAQNPNEVEHHNLEHVFVGHDQLDHTLMSNTDSERNIGNGHRDRAGATVLTLMKDNDPERERGNVDYKYQEDEGETAREVNLENASNPGHIYTPQRTEDVAINHDQNRSTGVTNLESAKHDNLEHTDLEQTRRDHIIDLDPRGTEERAELRSMQCHDLTIVQLWRRGTLPWEVQGLHWGKSQIEAISILVKCHKIRHVHIWRREASVWEVPGLCQRMSQGTVSFTKAAWNWTFQVGDDVD